MLFRLEVLKKIKKEGIKEDLDVIVKDEFKKNLLYVLK